MCLFRRFTSIDVRDVRHDALAFAARARRPARARSRATRWRRRSRPKRPRCGCSRRSRCVRDWRPRRTLAASAGCSRTPPRSCCSWVRAAAGAERALAASLPASAPSPASWRALRVEAHAGVVLDAAPACRAGPGPSPSTGRGRRCGRRRPAAPPRPARAAGPSSVSSRITRPRLRREPLRVLDREVKVERAVGPVGREHVRLRLAARRAVRFGERPRRRSLGGTSVNWSAYSISISARRPRSTNSKSATSVRERRRQRPSASLIRLSRLDRHADRVAPLGPAAVVVAHARVAEQVGEHEPGVAAALADAAVGDDVVDRAAGRSRFS